MSMVQSGVKGNRQEFGQGIEDFYNSTEILLWVKVHMSTSVG